MSLNRDTWRSNLRSRRYQPPSQKALDLRARLGRNLDGTSRCTALVLMPEPCRAIVLYRG